MEDANKTKLLSNLEIVTRQEEALQPNHFDAHDAWEVGMILRELGLKTGASLSLHISLLGAQVFHCGLGQPKPNFDAWIARKEKGTLECWKSSMRLKLEALTGGDKPSDHGFSDAEAAFVGGSFPIRLKNVGVVGAITVSGLRDTVDHQLGVDALAQFMGIEVPKLPAE